MEPCVSVIIPVFNVENYLSRCLTAVINQTYNNLEIILIDDGSVDASGLIADEFAGRDNRIRVFHQKNQGVAEARNQGLRVATGEWICFVDGDDELLPDAIRLLLEMAETKQTKISMGGYFECTGRKNRVRKKRVHAHNKVLYGEKEMYRYFLSEGRNFNFLWQKLYHKTVFQNLYFETGRNYEDLLLLPDILESGGSIAIMDEPVYNYRLRKDSITGSTDINIHMDGLYARKQWMSRMQKKQPDLVPLCADAILEYCCYLFGKMSAIGRKENKEAWNTVQNVFKENREKAEKHSLYLRIAVLLFSLSPVFLGRLCILYSNLKRV